jgi:hypothetical protein
MNVDLCTIHTVAVDNCMFPFLWTADLPSFLPCQRRDLARSDFRCSFLNLILLGFAVFTRVIVLAKFNDWRFMNRPSRLLLESCDRQIPLRNAQLRH